MISKSIALMYKQYHNIKHLWVYKLLEGKIKSKSEFSRNFLTVLTGSTIAFAIPVLISPILSRLYSPVEMGVFSFFLSVGSIISTVITGRFEWAIPLPKKDEDAKGIVYLTIAISITIISILFFILFFFKKEISTLLNIGQNDNMIFCIPLLALAASSFEVFTIWLNRSKNYYAVSKGKIGQSLFIGAIQVLFSFLGSVALIMGRFLGQFFGCLLLLSQVKGLKVADKEEMAPKMKRLAKEFKVFPLFNMPTNILNSASNDLPIFLLGGYFNLHVLGLFSWSQKIIQTPMTLIINSLNSVFFQEVAQFKNEDKPLYPLVSRIIRKLLLIGLVPYLSVGLLAPWIFSFVFGNEWKGAGIYTQYLIPWFFLSFVVTPLTGLLSVLNRQKERLVYAVGLFVARFLALYTGYFWFNSANVSIALYGLVGFLSSLSMLLFIIRVTKENDKNLLSISKSIET